MTKLAVKATNHTLKVTKTLMKATKFHLKVTKSSPKATIRKILANSKHKKSI